MSKMRSYGALEPFFLFIFYFLIYARWIGLLSKMRSYRNVETFLLFIFFYFVIHNVTWLTFLLKWMIRSIFFFSFKLENFLIQKYKIY